MNNIILLVDDEQGVLHALRRTLSDEPYEILIAASAEEALDIMQQKSFKVVVSDERMKGMQGSEFLSRVRALYPETVRIMLTGHATLHEAMMAVNEGEIYRFLAKPWDDLTLKFSIRSAIEKFNLEEENRHLLASLKKKSLEVKVLEKRYPGISCIEKDRGGAFILPDITDDEIDTMLAECEKEINSTMSTAGTGHAAAVSKPDQRNSN